MKYILFALALLISAPASAADKAAEIEYLRLDSHIRKLQETNSQLVKDIRDLQRKADEEEKFRVKMIKELNKISDELIKLKNNEIANLKASQVKLYKSIPILDWSNKERACESIGSKHQQIKSITRKDGAMTIRYLCFDGQVLHLGTEVNSAP